MNIPKQPTKAETVQRDMNKLIFDFSLVAQAFLIYEQLDSEKIVEYRIKAAELLGCNHGQN